MSSTGLDKGIKWMLEKADSNYEIGDTFKGLAELRSNGMINLIECDPPYGIDLKSQKSSKDSLSSNIHEYNEISAEDYQHFLDRLVKELFGVAGQHCWLVFWLGPTGHTQVYPALGNAGWQL